MLMESQKTRASDISEWGYKVVFALSLCFSKQGLEFIPLFFKEGKELTACFSLKFCHFLHRLQHQPSQLNLYPPFGYMSPLPMPKLIAWEFYIKTYLKHSIWACSRFIILLDVEFCFLGFLLVLVNEASIFANSKTVKKNKKTVLLTFEALLSPLVPILPFPSYPLCPFFCDSHLFLSLKFRYIYIYLKLILGEFQSSKVFYSYALHAAQTECRRRNLKQGG